MQGAERTRVREGTTSFFRTLLGIRIPKAIAREVGLDEGASVKVRVSGRDLVLAPASREYNLNELVARITAKNRHAETDWGDPVGNESW